MMMKVPRCYGGGPPIETALIERYKKPESSVKEAPVASTPRSSS
jgi:hypothetical protein